MTVFIPKYKCSCGYEIDATQQAGGNAKPSKGDYSLCLKCARVSIFNQDLTQREPTNEELVEIKRSSGWSLADNIIKKIVKEVC